VCLSQALLHNINTPQTVNAGLLKGTTPAQFEQLRQDFLQKVNHMFPAKQRGKRPSLPPQKGVASPCCMSNTLFSMLQALEFCQIPFLCCAATLSMRSPAERACILYELLA